MNVTAERRRRMIAVMTQVAQAARAFLQGIIAALRNAAAVMRRLVEAIQVQQQRQRDLAERRRQRRTWA